MRAAPTTKMGIATTCYMTAWRPRDTLEFIEHAQSLGGGGVQASLSSLDKAYVSKVRAKIEEYGMFLEVMGPLPRQDAAQFEAVLRAAKEAGAVCVRSACLSGRRYETFATLAAWKSFVDESHTAIKRGIPLAEKAGIDWALENHKDWTAAEFAAILRRYSSPRLGVCLDTGNNISLLDDPMEVVETLRTRSRRTSRTWASRRTRMDSCCRKCRWATGSSIFRRS